MKKLFKVFSFALVGLFALLALSFIIVNTKALSYDEDGYENDYNSVITEGMAYYMSTQYGENAAHEARFHYQSTQTDTYIMFTKASDTNWANAQKLDVRTTKLDYLNPPQGADGQDVKTLDFPEVSYEVEAEVNNLEPKTIYMWYATDGKTKSRLMTFETAPDGNEAFTFCFTSDSQVYTETGATNYSKQALEHLYDLIEGKLAKDETIHMNFMMNGGDVVENAGKAKYWDYYHNHSFAQRFAQMNIIGNHDFTGTVSSGTVDGRFWASQFNYPRNCPNIYQETAYYFYYGDCLIVSLSSAGGAKATEYAWLEEVLKNNTSQYIIVGSHYLCNSSSDTMKEFIPLFDKYGVDLVLQGHGHSYVLWDNYYNGKKNLGGEGTTYMEMGSCNFTDRAIFAMITVSETSIKVENYNYDGVLTSNYILQPKRPSSAKVSEVFNEEEFVSSVKVDVEPTERKTATVSFGDTAYGHLASISLTTTEGKVLLDKTVYGTKFNSASVTGLTPDTDYECTLKLTYRNGEVKESAYNFSTKISSYGTLSNIEMDQDEDYLRYTFNVEYHPTVVEVYSYLNGEKYKNLSMKNSRVTIDNLDLLEGKNIIELKGKLNDGSMVSIYTWEFGEEPKPTYAITYDLDGGTCSTNMPAMFEEGQEIALPVPTKDGYNFLGWFEGETKVESITESRDYNLVAKWEEIKEPTPIEPTPVEPTPVEPTPVEPTPVEPTPVEPTPVEPTPVEPTPVEPSKSGCKNMLVSLFMSISVIGVLFIRRRKF